MGENDIYPYAFEPTPDITLGDLVELFKLVNFRVDRDTYAKMNDGVRRHFVEKEDGE